MVPMTKLIPIIALVLLFVACEQNPDCQNQPSSVQKAEVNTDAGCSTPEAEPDPIPDPADPIPEVGEVPNEAMTFDINAKLFNFERSDEEKVLKAFEIIKKVVASPAFRERVLNFTYQGKKQFFDNEGKSNAEIYQMLLDGREDLVPQANNQMDLELQLYYSWKSTVGYTTPGELRIYVNTKFFDPYTPSQVAGNVFHEWTHKLGFDHATSYSVSRDSSVPYAIGYLIVELGKQYE
jgi:hypothetical protein